MCPFCASEIFKFAIEHAGIAKGTNAATPDVTTLLLPPKDVSSPMVCGLTVGREQFTGDFTFAASPGFMLFESKVDNCLEKPCMGPEIFLKVFISIYI